MGILTRIGKFFQKGVAIMSKLDFSGLSAAGAGAKKIETVSVPAVISPTFVPAPASREPIIMQPVPATKPERALCPHCGQPMPVIAAPVVPAGPSPIDEPWNDLDRTDLPPRTSTEIARLIAAGETEAAREKRILNDRMRMQHRYERAGSF